MRRALAIGAAMVAVFGSTAAVAEREAATAYRAIEFEGRTWRHSATDRVSVREYGGKTALHIRGPRSTSSVFLPAVEFQNGTIEVDVAAPGRSTPTIGFRGRKNGRWTNRIVFNRWPSDDKSKRDVVEQAAVTRRASTLLLLNIRKAAREGRAWAEAHEWFHVKVVVLADSVKVFLNGNAKPDIEVGAMFDRGEKGVLGLCGADCYFANFRCRAAR